MEKKKLLKLKQQNTLLILLAVLVSVYLLLHKIWFSPDQFFVFAAILMLFVGRLKNFLKDWTLPVSLLLFYDYLRGVLPHLTELPHVNPMVKFAMLKGYVTGVALQRLLSSDLFHWYDFIAVLLYTTHWIIPMIVGLIFWLDSRDDFKEYFWTLVILSYLALVTFVLFPTMPPWMAAANGYIMPLKDIYDLVNPYLFPSFYIPTVYQFIGPNLVAAVPSLHSAYPWVTFLFLSRKFPKTRIPVFFYVLSIWITLLYLGEHYTFDILMGVIYAQFSYFVVTRRIKIFNKVKLLLSKF